MESKMLELSFGQNVCKEIENKHIFATEIKSQELDKNYLHPTYIIDSLSTFVQIISIMSSMNESSFIDKSVIYRGMSDTEYLPIPSLNRLEKLDEDIEHALINDFLTLRPADFSGLHTEFDMLAKMQHYGLPTRLLDFTANPLVALYFACENNFCKDGRILCHNTFLTYDDIGIIKAICKTSFDKWFDNCRPIEYYVCKDSFSLYSYLKRIYLVGEPIVARPKYWNQRIRNQAGIFMVFPNNIYDRYGKIAHYAREFGIDQAMIGLEPTDDNKTLIKEIMRIEPVSIYNNKFTLTDESLQNIVSSYPKDELRQPSPRSFDFSDEYKKFFYNRFTIDADLKPISNKIMQEDCCSILIKSENKKKILHELASVGIDIDFIYPELEYTAQKIKRKYE